MLLIGERYKIKLAIPLARLGCEVVWLPDNPDVAPELAGHADLSAFAADNMLVAAESVYDYVVQNLTNRGFTVIRSAPQGKCYPADAGLCICRTGKYAIYNPQTVDRTVLPLLSGLKTVSVHQGYAKCAVCVVSDDAIITSDAGIAKTARIVGMDVLEITPGYIALDGYDYGFIGGASFAINNEMIAFTGSLASHPNAEKISSFITQRGKSPVFLTNELLLDIGGAITLP